MLTPNQQRAIGMLSMGMDTSTVAQTCNVCRATLHRWKNDKEFKASLDKNVAEMMGALVTQVQNTARNLIEGGLESARELRHLVLHDHTPPNVKRHACNDILRYQQRYLELMGYSSKAAKPRKLLGVDDEDDPNAEDVPDNVPDEACGPGDRDKVPITEVIPENPMLPPDTLPQFARDWMDNPITDEDSAVPRAAVSVTTVTGCSIYESGLPADETAPASCPCDRAETVEPVQPAPLPESTPTGDAASHASAHGQHGAAARGTNDAAPIDENPDSCRILSHSVATTTENSTEPAGVADHSESPIGPIGPIRPIGPIDATDHAETTDPAPPAPRPEDAPTDDATPPASAHGQHVAAARGTTGTTGTNGAASAEEKCDSCRNASHSVASTAEAHESSNTDSDEWNPSKGPLRATIDNDNHEPIWIHVVRTPSGRCKPVKPRLNPKHPNYEKLKALNSSR